jgi:hypothetical protein
LAGRSPRPVAVSVRRRAEGCRRQSEGSGSLHYRTMLEAVPLGEAVWYLTWYHYPGGDTTGTKMELS